MNCVLHPVADQLPVLRRPRVARSTRLVGERDPPAPLRTLCTHGPYPAASRCAVASSGLTTTSAESILPGPESRRSCDWSPETPYAHGCVSQRQPMSLALAHHPSTERFPMS